MKYFIPVVLFLSVATGCNKENNLEPGDNLILNGSFEDNGNFSMDGWINTNSDSETDVPGGGGNYSLKLVPGSSPSEGYAEYEFTGITGTMSYTLSCFIKAFGDWPGNISLRKISNGGLTSILGIEASSENEWKELTLSANVTLATGDKLVVRISAGSTESPTPEKYVLFDLVELKEN